MSSTDATIHVAQNFINTMLNPAPTISLITLGNAQKELLRYLAHILVKATSPSVPMRVPIEKLYPDKLQQVNKEKS